MRNEIYREKILHCLILIKFANKVEEEKKPTKVTNADGKNIILSMDEGYYFDMLKQAWK
jgi:hypothetical protein